MLPHAPRVKMADIPEESVYILQGGGEVGRGLGGRQGQEAQGKDHEQTIVKDLNHIQSKMMWKTLFLS